MMTLEQAKVYAKKFIAERIFADIAEMVTVLLAEVEGSDRNAGLSRTIKNLSDDLVAEHLRAQRWKETAEDSAERGSEAHDTAVLAIAEYIKTYGTGKCISDESAKALADEITEAFLCPGRKS